MRRFNLLLAMFTLFAFLSQGMFSPVQAQHKPMEKAGKRHKMMQEQPPQKMQMTGRTHKKMGMPHHSMEHTQMMADPVLRSLHNFGCPGFLLENAEILNLDEKQKETLTNLKNEFKKVAIKTNADIKVAALDIKQAMSKDKPDYDQVEKAINTIHQLKKQLHDNFFNTLKNARKVLTDDQLQKLKTLSQEGKPHKMPMK